MQVEQYYSDDYAGLVSGKFQFYYGYEVEDEKTHEWCFQVKENGEEIYRITTFEIEKNMKDHYQLNMPQDYLVAGIGLWLLIN